MNKTGKPSEIWFVEENNKDKPNRFPAGWKSNQLRYHDKTIIESSVMIDELLENQVPNNWIITLDKIREGDIGKPLHLKHPDSYSPPYAPDSSPYTPDSSPYAPRTSTNASNSPPYAPTSPPYAPTIPAYASTSPAYNPNSLSGDGNDSRPPSPDYPPPGYFSPHSPNTPPPSGSRVLVLDSDKPVVIMPNQPSIETTSKPELEEIKIDTESEDKPVEKIEEMINKMKPKRDDGIELIINDTLSEEKKDEEKEKENENEGEKKTIKLN
jgi:hypothetical protein